MSIIDRFGGGEAEGEGKRLVANTEIKDALNFQLLFAEEFNLSELGLTKALRAHPKCCHQKGASAEGVAPRVEIEQACAANGTPLGLVGWGDHVMRLIGFNNAPMPEEVLAHSLQVSNIEQALKSKAREHVGHVLLSYAGYATDPFEQYEALAIVSGILADAGAFMVVNLRATSCVPTYLLSPTKCPDFELSFTQILPSMLYYGFVKYFIPDSASGWVRTMGSDALYLPDLAANLPNMAHASDYFFIFKEIYDHIIASGVVLYAGDTLELEGKRHFKLRYPDEETEYFLESDGLMLVVEPGSEFESKRVATGKVRKSEKNGGPPE